MHLIWTEKVASWNGGMQFIASEHELDILSTAKDSWQHDQTLVLMTRGGHKDCPDPHSQQVTEASHPAGLIQSSFACVKSSYSVLL